MQREHEHEAENSDTEWNISFVGCGFLGIYYFGVYSCLLERAQHLIKSTGRICGASSGALIAAMIVCQMSPAKCCENLMILTKEARKGMLSSMHPSLNLLKLMRRLMVRELPDNAHLLASEKLYISLTRLSDGRNVLVSKFSSKEDLIQALICSCFFPVYCGVVPPRYHGARYIDGALSDSTPFSNLKNTIIVSPFSGESDICPDDIPVYCQEVRICNMSINVNLLNVHRVIQAFFPPEPEVMADICHNGYKDTLVFLKENDFLEQSSLTTEFILNYRQQWSGLTSCTEDNQETNLLPVSVQKVFFKATKIQGWKRDQFVKLLLSTLMMGVLPVQMIYFVLLRLAGWMVVTVSNLQMRIGCNVL